MDHRTWDTAREDGRRASEDCSATAEENPAALVIRWRIARHEAGADGDPGKDDETEVSARGLDGPAGSLEEPAKAGAGRRTKGAGPRVEPLEWAPSPWRTWASREHAEWWPSEWTRKPEDRPRTGETRPCLPTSDPGTARSISNNDDCQRSQINLFGPAKDFSKIEIRSEVVTTLNVGAGEGETGRPRGRCWSPGGTAEPSGWRGTPSIARSPELRWWGEGIVCHPPCEEKPLLWCCRKRQPPCDPVEKTETGEDPVGQQAGPWRLWRTPRCGRPTGLKRSDDRDGAPHPTSEAADQKCRSGDTWQRDTPRDRRGRWSHHWRSRRHSIYADTGSPRSWRSQDRWRQSWRDRNHSLPPGTRWASEERTPRSDSHKLAVGEAQDWNSAAVDCSREMRSADVEARKEVESMTTPRNWTISEGTRSEFWGLTTIPQLLTKLGNSLKIPEEGLPRGWLD